MALDDDKRRLRSERAARYRRLSALLGEDAATGQLRALAERLDEQLDKAAAEASRRVAETLVLLAEIDTFLSRAGGNRQGVPEAGRAAACSAAGLREASRLCREEAAAADASGKTALAIRAFDLAQLAEAFDRDSGRGP